MRTLLEICPDFPEWPKRWMGIEQDLEYGKDLLEIMRPFAEYLAKSNLTKKTVSKHLTNLWLLGGEIIRNVSLYEEYSTSALKKLKGSVGSDGGPYCRHINSEAEMRSFDSTCRKLHKYLENQT
jgi:hypothetical protein